MCLSVSFTLLICSLLFGTVTKVVLSVNEYTSKKPSPSRMYRSRTALNTSCDTFVCVCVCVCVCVHVCVCMTLWYSYYITELCDK